MSQRSITCHHCAHAWAYESPLERRAECPDCGRDARVCRNCRHFDPAAHHECREEQAEWVKDKDRANFCSYFEAAAGAAREGEAAAAKAKLAGLFGGANPEAARPKAGLAGALAAFLDAKK